MGLSLMGYSVCSPEPETYDPPRGERVMGRSRKF